MAMKVASTKTAILTFMFQKIGCLINANIRSPEKQNNNRRAVELLYPANGQIAKKNDVLHRLAPARL
jgi:hypothetical protein